MEFVNKHFFRFLFIVLLKIVPSYQYSHRDCLIDVVFVVEESSLVSAANYNLTMNLVKEIVKNLNLEENGVHIGVSCYSNNYRNIFDLDFYYSKSQMMEQLNRMKQLQNGGQPNIPYGLNQSCTNMFVSSAGNRSRAQNFLVLISGSAQNSGTASELETSIHVCHDNGVRIISVDEDSVSSDLIKNIADSPSYHFDISSNGDTLGTVAVSISTMISDNAGCREVVDRLAILIDILLYCSLAIITLVMCLICFLQNRYLQRKRAAKSEQTNGIEKKNTPGKKNVQEKTALSTL